MKKNRKSKKHSAEVGEQAQQTGSFLRTYLRHLTQEGTLIFCLAGALFLFVALVSYHRSDPGFSHSVQVSQVVNSAGKVGAWLADMLLYIFGYIAYVFPLMLGYGAWQAYRLARREDIAKSQRRWVLLIRLVGFIVVLSSACGLLSIHALVPFSALPYSTGGIIGVEFGRGLLSSFNMLGANVILLALLFLGVTLCSGFSWLRLLENTGAFVIRASSWSYQFFKKASWRRLFSFRRKAAMSESTTLVTPSGDTMTARVAPAPIAMELPEKPVIEAPRKVELKDKMTANMRNFRRKKSGTLPNLDLLDSPPKQQSQALDKRKIEQRSEEVELRLKDFGIEAKVVSVHPGPVVTRYELQLAAGTKVSKISGLAKDLARSLSVTSVRVVEVIPGKSVIGLELPNENREGVYLQEVLASKQYQNSRSALTLALGKDISGHPIVVDLAKMPHLLVAGTTGSGKSVGLNAMLLSLLYKASPEELRLILIDPKMLELSIYDGVPHLLAPVVTDMKDAATALRWCVVEMERRYRLMASMGVRNIAGFNTKVKEAQQRGEPLYDPLLGDADNKPELTPLPQIVVLADEFADMMVVVGKKVETLIARLAQKARAAGIHLIFATQRPSVDVITGLIKANIPTRIAFQVSSKVDSRTILDQQGAEQLLGNGDMLYLPPGSGVPNRVHGAYVHDDEVHRVVAALKEIGEPEYVSEVLDECSGTDASGYTQAAFGTVDDDGEKDPLYDQAVEAVVRSRRVSISSIQRRFKIGYNRAARIVEAMEVAGVVSNMENTGAREVLAPPIAEE